MNKTTNKFVMLLQRVIIFIQKKKLIEKALDDIEYLVYNFID